MTSWRVRLATAIAASAIFAACGPSHNARPRTDVNVFEEGSQAVPAAARETAIDHLNGYLCAGGRLGSVVTQGATRFADLEELQPNLIAGQGSTWEELAPDTPIFAVVVRGSCTVGDDEPYAAIQGYVLFRGNGIPLYYRVWKQGLEPSLPDPFGPEVDAAIAI